MMHALWQGSEFNSPRIEMFVNCAVARRHKSAARGSRKLRGLGLSLLEVVLALSVLGVSAAIMAQAMQLAVRNALRAQNLAHAELVAESVMSQVVAGILPAQATTWAPYYSTSTLATPDSSWVYMITIVPAEIQGMMGIQIGVRDSSQPSVDQRPDYVVTQWIIDPSLGLDTPPDTTSTEDASGTGSTGGSTGTSSTGSTQAGAR